MDTLIKSIEGTTIQVRMQSGGYKKFDVLDLFKINPDDLSTEMANQAAIFGFFSVIAVMAEDVANKAAFTKDQEEASADLDCRERLLKEGTKFTEATIRALVMADASYDQVCKMELKTRYDFKLLKAIVTALDMRSNMLVSLGANMRHELDATGMNIREHALNAGVETAKAILEEGKESRKKS